MVLLIDNYDSFTYILRDYILQTGQECTVIRNDEMTMEEIEALNFSSAVISPGPKRPADAGVTMSFIKRYHTSLPILGICLGHQALGEFFGAKLVKANRPMHGKASTITHTNHFIFSGLPDELEVGRYHSLVLSDIESTPFDVTARTKENEIMALTHPELKLAGLQFHPESILTPNGLQMIKNWFAGI